MQMAAKIALFSSDCNAGAQRASQAVYRSAITVNINDRSLINACELQKTCLVVVSWFF